MTGKERKGKTGLKGTMVLGGMILLALVSTHWVRLNVQPSVPYGFYRLAGVPVSLERGMLVVLPVPALVAFWHHPWWVPLMKPAAGLEGDVVCQWACTLYVNDVDYGPVLSAAHDQPLPQLVEGCFTVPAGQVFLASRAPRSLDGRYFGMTPIPTLTAHAVPLWTWR